MSLLDKLLACSKNIELQNNVNYSIDQIMWSWEYLRMFDFCFVDF